MPAKSKSQQRLFGMVDAYKNGELKKASKKIKDIADGMSEKEVKKFAKTKHRGLPEEVKHKKKTNENVVRLTESDIHRMVKESINTIIESIEEERTTIDNAKNARTFRNFQNRVQEANDALKATEEYNSRGIYTWMDREGDIHYVNGNIRLTRSGVLVISEGQRNVIRIKVFDIRNGSITKHIDPYYEEDYSDAWKLLQQITRGAKRFIADMQGYDPNWEDEQNPNPKAIRDFNKSIGVKADARKPY